MDEKFNDDGLHACSTLGHEPRRRNVNAEVIKLLRTPVLCSLTEALLIVNSTDQLYLISTD